MRFLSALVLATVTSSIQAEEWVPPIIPNPQTILREAENEVLPLLDNAETETSVEDELAALLFRIAIQGSKTQIIALRKKLTEWLEECESLESDAKDDQRMSFRGLVLFYPVSSGEDK